MNTYYPDTLSAFNNGRSRVCYENNDKEILDLSQESWRYCQDANALSGALKAPFELQSNEQRDLERMFDRFGNRPFLSYNAQSFSS